MGVSAPAGAVPTGVRPPFSFWSCPKRECAAPGGREKGAWARSGAVALRARRGSAYRCKRRFGPTVGHAILFCNFCNCCPVAEGAEVIGVVIALPLRLLSLPRAIPRGSRGSGPMRASAPTTTRVARSEAERAEREAGQMRPCTPTTFAPSATGRQFQKSQKIVACPKVGPNRRLHRYADPRCARRATAPERAQAIFSLPPGAAHSLFVKNKKRMGGAPLWEQPPWQEPDPRGRRTAAPISPGG